MSRHKMTKSEAVVILGKYFACEKRIHNCHGNCDKCKYDYDKYALRRAVEIAFKALVGDGKAATMYVMEGGVINE